MATMAGLSQKRTPRWWRRFVVASRRANLISLVEILAVAIFAIMVVFTWAAFTRAPPTGELLPSRQVAVLLIGLSLIHI